VIVLVTNVALELAQVPLLSKLLSLSLTVTFLDFTFAFLSLGDEGQVFLTSSLLVGFDSSRVSS
jgi:hypothetical protein